MTKMLPLHRPSLFCIPRPRLLPVVFITGAESELRLHLLPLPNQSLLQLITCFTMTSSVFPPLSLSLSLSKWKRAQRGHKIYGCRLLEIEQRVMSDPARFWPLSLFLLLWIESPAPAGALTAASDVAALAALKAAVSPASINPWSCLASWNFSSDPCRPATPTHFLCGLACSPDATRVTVIALDSAGYSGGLPASLSNLTLLAVLDISDNAFRGPIPPSLASLPALQTLSLSANALSGDVPPALANLSSLETLDLSRNALTGGVPRSLASLSKLRALDLSFNRLWGSLPSYLPPNLVELALRGNYLSGTLTRSTFERLRLLEVAELAVNRLEGRLEGWFLQLPSLQQVDLANNSLSGVEVWAGGGERLVAVDVGFNRIEGELPARLAGYPALAALSVRHNRLRGPIPWEYMGAKKGAPFRRLFLDGNFLKGRIPAELLQGAGDVAGSVGDNCLEGCPSSLQLCSPVQKPDSVCRQAYGTGGRPRSYLGG